MSGLVIPPHRVFLDSRTEIEPWETRVLRAELSCLFRAEDDETSDEIDYRSFFWFDLEVTASAIRVKVRNIGERPRRFAICYVGKAVP